MRVSFPVALLVLAVGTAAPLSAQSVAEGQGCLPGNWYLDNTDLFLAIRTGLQASQSGTDFELEEISGDYLASIDPEDATITVDWANWQMRGTAVTQRSGSFPVVMTLDGAQYYDITSLDDSTMTVALTRNVVNASVTMGGMTVPNAGAIVPPFGSGSWNCAVDTLTVQSEGWTWTFERADF